MTTACWCVGTSAHAQDGEIIVVPSDPQGVNQPPGVGIGVTNPGHSGTPGHTGGTGGLGGQSGGQLTPPCTSTPIPGANTSGSPNDPTWTVCSGSTSGVVSGPAAAALPSPAQLAQQAYQQMHMPVPVPRRSPDLRLPDGRSATLVGENTWIWTDRSAWVPQKKRASAGPVWAEVTAVPIHLSFESGLTPQLVCAGPGTPYDRKYGLHASSPDCGRVFARSSYGQPGDQITAKYGITWRVTWTGNTGSAPASGSLSNMISRAEATFAVAEAQALVR
nr:putative ATP/GTP-binding protein [Kibdelosporangium sp. MJ126-NF4]